MKKPKDRSRTFITVFFVSAITAAGCMFAYKLHAFLQTIKRSELDGFAFDPIMIYGFVAMGFVFLLTWAYMSGQFRNIEQPKFDMLERFDEQERAERLAKEIRSNG